MKVLFIASNPNGEVSLDLDREITELSRHYLTASDDPPMFMFLPKLSVEELQSAVLRFRPDILHISAHGEKEYLRLSDGDGNHVKITAKMLRAFLPPDYAPRLVYLSACDSNEIAIKLVDSGAVPMAIGTTTSISNRAAVASAVSFYGSLLSGLGVEDAFNASRSLIEALTDSKATAKIHGHNSANSMELSLSIPHLIADFDGRPRRSKKDDHYSLRLGVKGCPSSTIQVIFFTDDESFIKDDDTYENDLSLVVRSMPVNGILWAPEDVYWRATGDHRLFAAGVKAGGGGFVLSGTLAEAIENRYRLAHMELPAPIAVAVDDLRENDGAELNPTVYDEKYSRKTKKKTARKKKKKKRKS